MRRIVLVNDHGGNTDTMRATLRERFGTPARPIERDAFGSGPGGRPRFAAAALECRAPGARMMPGSHSPRILGTGRPWGRDTSRARGALVETGWSDSRRDGAAGARHATGSGDPAGAPRLTHG